MMYLMKKTARWLVALAVVAAPIVGLAAEEKKGDDALMEPVKSVLESYLAIQKELAKDSLKHLSHKTQIQVKAFG